MKAVLSLAISNTLLVSSLAVADASYQETTQITGGTLVDSLKSSPLLRLGGASAKKLFDPINKLVLVHGNQMAIVSATGSEIIDIDQETTTRIDNEKKTYSVTTFTEMRQAFKDAPKKLEQAQAQMQQQPAATPNNQAPQLQITFDVSTSDTGETKLVNGQTCKEQIFTIKAHITDPKADPAQGPTTMTYNYADEVWTTPDPPEVRAVQDFYQRYSKKLMEGIDVSAMMKAVKPMINGSALAPMFANNPGLGSAMQEMAKKMEVEQAKIRGTRVLEITRLGGDVPAGTATAAGAPPATGDVATQAATQAATDSAASQAGSRFGGLGSLVTRGVASAFAKRSADKPAGSAPPATPTGPTSAVLYETTTQKSQFSEETVPPDAFQVPSGYKKIASPMQQMAAAAK
ncbi:MAG: hypothetical protein ABSD02_24645 [Steroidobacteraceae bacterium]|jgi:hypothetical protein